MMSPTIQQALDRLKELRDEYQALMEAEYLLVHEELNGRLLNRRGEAKGIDPWSLFRSNWTYVKAYGSEELIEWFTLNPRLTFAQYERQMLESDVDPTTLDGIGYL